MKLTFNENATEDINITNVTFEKVAKANSLDIYSDKMKQLEI